MTLQQPLSSAASKLGAAISPHNSTDDSSTAKSDLVVIGGGSRSWSELALGSHGSTRRQVSTFALLYAVSTIVRVALFEPRIAGAYLEANLGPVERPAVAWWIILAVRAVDLLFALGLWPEVDGLAKRDGALFGGLFAAVSRSSLYFFEHSYYLLDSKTTFAVFSIDVLTYAAALSLLPKLVPHPVSARPTLSAWQRFVDAPELLLNVVIAAGLGTCVGAVLAFVVERVGGQAFVRANAMDLQVPAVYAADTMTTAQMMAHPTVDVPSLRSDLSPLPMIRHLVHSAGITATVTPFAVMLSRLSPLGIGLVTFLLVGPASALLYYDVLPTTLYGAIGTAGFLAARASIVATVVAWVIEELREPRKVEEIDIVVVDEDTGEVVAAAEIDIEVTEKPLARRRTASRASEEL